MKNLITLIVMLALAMGISAQDASNTMPDCSARTVNDNGVTVTVTRHKGDANNDGLVDGSDLNTLIGVILKQVPTPEGDELSYFDLNDDGEVDGTDLNVLIDVVLGKLVLPDAMTEIFTVDGVEFKMERVEHGTFTMGATAEQGSDANDVEKPAHQVTLTQDYYIGQTEVTQELWQAVMGSDPSSFKGDNRPVESVSWNDCQTFITKLNQLTGREFRLPTEAEWEFAARGGNKSQGYKYAGSNTLGDVAWYWDNIPSQSSGDAGYGTQTVATKAPNELGLYDMSGNVWEWCQDWYGNYSSAAQTDPTGPASGSYRVYRGGGWYNSARRCRVSSRDGSLPANANNFHLGLRLAL